ARPTQEPAPDLSFPAQKKAAANDTAPWQDF
ncbi:hypothetical protein EV216_14315, partial [Rhodovulum steppense]